MSFAKIEPMKKLLFILLLVPILEAKEYTFACEDDKYKGSSVKSIVVNTKEKYILLGNLKFADKWSENEATVTASMRYTTTVINTIDLNKITGKMNETFVGDTGTIDSIDYTCKAVVRLMP